MMAGTHTIYVIVSEVKFLLTPTKRSILEVWSNFEIADMDFWRGEAYSKFFDHLDQTGGFYYEVRIRFRQCRLQKSNAGSNIDNSAGETHRYIR